MRTSAWRNPRDSRVELGSRCDECGGDGRLPNGKCPMCHGCGEIVWIMSLAEFRELESSLA